METDQLRQRSPVRWLTVTALFLAMNVALSSFGMPVPGGHLYLNDIVICTAAILLDPLGAFMVGGVVLCFPCGLRKLWEKWSRSKQI